MLNRVFLIGRIGRDPELRYTATSGRPVVTFSLATDRITRTESGEKNRQTDWHRIVVWGDRAQWCSENLSRGKLILVEGRLRTRKWQDRNGMARTTVEVVADRIQFVGPKELAPEETSLETPQEMNLQDISSIPTVPEEDESLEEEEK